MHFVLYYVPAPEPPSADLERLLAASDVTIVEHELPRLLLVDCEPSAAERLATDFPGWAVSGETSFQHEH